MKRVLSIRPASDYTSQEAYCPCRDVALARMLAGMERFDVTEISWTLESGSKRFFVACSVSLSRSFPERATKYCT